MRRGQLFGATKCDMKQLMEIQHPAVYCMYTSMGGAVLEEGCGGLWCNGLCSVRGCVV